MVPPPLPVSDGSPPVEGEVQPQPVPADRCGGAGLDAGHLQEEHDRRAEEKDEGEEERENKGLTKAGDAKADHLRQRILVEQVCSSEHVHEDRGDEGHEGRRYKPSLDCVIVVTVFGGSPDIKASHVREAKKKGSSSGHQEVRRLGLQSLSLKARIVDLHCKTLPLSLRSMDCVNFNLPYLKKVEMIKIRMQYILLIILAMTNGPLTMHIS